MINVAQVAMQLGELHIPEGRLFSIDEIDRYEDKRDRGGDHGQPGRADEWAFAHGVCRAQKAGNQSERYGHRVCHAHSGNEKSVSRVIDQLMRTGADVIYKALAEVHVSGHAKREELKLIHVLTRPKYFIPIHGEYRHLKHHANLAISLGMDPKRTLVPDNGDIIEVNDSSMHTVGTVPAGAVLIDGLGVGDVGAVVLRDRKKLSTDGMLIVVMGIDHELGEVVSGPDIITRGFVYMREADTLLEGARNAAIRALGNYGRIEPSDWNHLKNDVRDCVQKYIYDTIKRNPMILPIVVEI